MKKFLAVLLSIVMMFSVMTVAFAAEEGEGSDDVIAEETPDTGDEKNDDDEILDYIMNLPLGQAKVLFKLAVRFLHLLKLIDKLHIVDLAGAIKGVTDWIMENLPENAPQQPDTAAAV